MPKSRVAPAALLSAAAYLTFYWTERLRLTARPRMCLAGKYAEAVAKYDASEAATPTAAALANRAAAHLKLGEHASAERVRLCTVDCTRGSYTFAPRPPAG